MNKKIILSILFGVCASIVFAYVFMTTKKTTDNAENITHTSSCLGSTDQQYDLNLIFNKSIEGYKQFRQKYAVGDQSIMQTLAEHGQKPDIMVVACSDSRVDPALILQCDPGDLFIVRNVANIVPPYEKKDAYHGTSAALEFGIRFLNIKHLIILGHSQCSGVKASMDSNSIGDNDFISNWVSLIKMNNPKKKKLDLDDHAKYGLTRSCQNCSTFPWLKERLDNNDLVIHLWFFDIKSGQIFTYDKEKNTYIPLSPQ